MNDPSDIQNGHVRLATQEDEALDAAAIASVDAETEAEVNVETDEEVGTGAAATGAGETEAETGAGETEAETEAETSSEAAAIASVDAETEAEVNVETDEEVGTGAAATGAGETEAETEAETSSERDAEATPKARKSSSETLESEAEIAADYLEELLDIADLDGDIDTYIEGDRAHVSVVSGSNVLVGPNGTVLDALQELARLAVMTETGERSRLMLDVAGFRERRRTELISLAAEAVEEVKTSQEKVPLAPMNPFERKIVHDAVAAAGLTSASEGEEPRRHVVVLPVG